MWGSDVGKGEYYLAIATFNFFHNFLFSNIKKLNHEQVLETFDLLTVEQLLLYFIFKQTYTRIKYKFYSYLVTFNHKYMQNPKTIQNRDLF